MNSLERVARTVRFEQADRVPVIAQVFGGAGTLAGVPIDQYVQDGTVLAGCQLKALRHFGYDAVFSVMDVNVEAEAIGAVLKYRPNHYPVIDRHPLSPESDPGDLVMPDPSQAGRMPQMLKAVSILRQELGNQVPIVGCVMGPLTLATQLLGLETALYLAIDDSPRLERLMDFATEVVIRFGVAQLQAGAHLLVIFNPSASPAVVPPPFFREFELPRLRRLSQVLTKAGSMANWLHIAGPAGLILRHYAQADVQIANFDYVVSAQEACRRLPAMCLDGNIRSLAFVDSTPDRIEAQSQDLLRVFRDRGGFILSSGCEIPPESPPDNIAAMVQAVIGGR